MLDEPLRPHEEAIETTVGVDTLDPVEETCDDVVSTGCLSPREDDTDVHSLTLLPGLCGLEGELR